MEERAPSSRCGADTGDIRREEGEGPGLDQAARQPEDEDERGGDSGQQRQEAGAGQENLQSILPQEQSSALQRSDHIKPQYEGGF